MDFGKYKLSNANADHNFTKINFMWDQYIDSSRSKEDPKKMKLRTVMMTTR